MVKELTVVCHDDSHETIYKEIAMNIKQLIIAGILSIGMPVMAFAAGCPEDICDDANKKATSLDAGKASDLKPVQVTPIPVTATSKSNTDIPTYTVPQK